MNVEAKEAKSLPFIIAWLVLLILAGLSVFSAFQRLDVWAPIVEFGVEKPGDLVIVDHSIFRAFNQGALGMIHVTGNDNARVFAAIKGLGIGKE